RLYRIAAAADRADRERDESAVQVPEGARYLCAHGSGSEGQFHCEKSFSAANYSVDFEHLSAACRSLRRIASEAAVQAQTEHSSVCGSARRVHVHVVRQY